MTRRPRQLELAGLGPAPEKPMRAKRDWTPAEFARALARNGLRPTYGGTYFADAEGNHFAAAWRAWPIRIARRATVAQIRRAKRALAESDRNAGDESDRGAP